MCEATLSDGQALSFCRKSSRRAVPTALGVIRTVEPAARTEELLLLSIAGGTESVSGAAMPVIQSLGLPPFLRLDQDVAHQTRGAPVVRLMGQFETKWANPCGVLATQFGRSALDPLSAIPAAGQIWREA